MNLKALNPAATYSFVLLGDKDNLDGTRDFVVRLSGNELLDLLDLVRDLNSLEFVRDMAGRAVKIERKP